MSAPRPTWFRPMTLALGLLFGLLAVVVPSIPEPYRPWNFAVFGAVGLFLGARAGLLPGLAVSLLAKVAFDLLNYHGHGGDADYLPSPIVYVSFAFYPLIGLLLKRTENPLAVVAAAAAGGVPFFLLTNFSAWVGQAMPYPMTVAGLLDCYTQAVPFHRPTLAGDLLFSVTLFAAHAVLSRTLFPAEQVETVSEAEANPV